MLALPAWDLDRSLVTVAFLGFVIAAEIDPDEPSPLAASDDLANFASHRVSSWLAKRDTHPANIRS
jgi:hypothetical protein